MDKTRINNKIMRIFIIGFEILLFVALVVFYILIIKDHPGSPLCWIIPSAPYVKPFSIVLSVFSFIPMSIYLVIIRTTISIREPVAISRIINLSANLLLFVVYLGVGTGCTVYVNLVLYLFIQLCTMIIPFILFLFFNWKNRKKIFKQEDVLE